MASEQTLTLYPSRARWIFILLICLAFTAIGVFAIRTDGGLMPWFVFLVFAAGAAITIVQLLPGASYLRLHSKGFDVCSLYRKWPTIPWNSTGPFHVTFVGKSMVVFEAEGLGKETLQQISRAIAGAGAGLPDNYGMKPQQLANLMNEWRSRVTFSDPGSM